MRGRERKKVSVTILGDLLHFGQLFNVCGNNYLAQIAHIFVKVSKSFMFLVKSFLGNFQKTFGDFLLVTLVKEKERGLSSSTKKNRARVCFEANAGYDDMA